MKRAGLSTVPRAAIGRTQRGAAGCRSLASLGRVGTWSRVHAARRTPWGAGADAAENEIEAEPDTAAKQYQADLGARRCADRCTG